MAKKEHRCWHLRWESDYNRLDDMELCLSRTFGFPGQSGIDNKWICVLDSLKSDGNYGYFLWHAFVCLEDPVDIKHLDRWLTGSNDDNCYGGIADLPELVWGQPIKDGRIPTLIVENCLGGQPYIQRGGPLLRCDIQSLDIRSLPPIDALPGHLQSIGCSF